MLLQVLLVQKYLILVSFHASVYKVQMYDTQHLPNLHTDINAKCIPIRKPIFRLYVCNNNNVFKMYYLEAFQKLTLISYLKKMFKLRYSEQYFLSNLYQKWWELMVIALKKVKNYTENSILRYVFHINNHVSVSNITWKGG